MVEKLLTRAEVAEVLHRSPMSVWKDAKQGKLRCVRIGGTLRFPQSEVERVIKEGY